MSVPVISNGQQLTGDNVQLRQACQQLESFFWNQLLTAMDKTIPDDGMLGDSFAKDIYRDMLNQQYALLLAQQGSNNNLGDILYRQLNQQLQQQAIKTTDDNVGLMD